MCKCGVPMQTSPPKAHLLRGIAPNAQLEWGIKLGEVLPAGLVMDLKTGTISGCPLEATSETSYTVEISEVHDIDAAAALDTLYLSAYGEPSIYESGDFR